MTEYKWKDGARVTKLNAQKVGARLEKMRQKHGVLTPQAVVRDARKKTSPLHSAFEWDDAVAARGQRLDRARDIIRSVTVTITGVDEDDTKIVRAFLYTGDAYEDLHTVLSTVEKRPALLTAALSELNAVRRRYAALSELAEVFAALDRAAA